MIYQSSIIIHTILITSLLILTPMFGVMGVILSRLIFLFSTVITSTVYWKKVYKLNTKF